MNTSIATLPARNEDAALYLVTPSATQYKYQVNFDKVFISGPLVGRRYHDHLRFTTFNDAKFFARRDGLIVAPCDGNSDYRQEDSIIIDIAQYV